MTDTSTSNQIRRAWWAQMRWRYNKGLIIAGISAFFCYCVLGSCLIAPYDNEFEVTIFSIAFQSVGYLLMMIIANLFYSLGYVVDSLFNQDGSDLFRTRLYKLGYWFSFALPFLIPVFIVVEYFVRYAK